MKIKEQTIKELESMNPAEMMIIYDLILSLKRKHASHIVEDIKYEKTNKLQPYIKVRNALKNCTGSMSEDILLEREERV
jgi:CTP:phosphocholine cytidylyltransferase-like protein